MLIDQGHTDEALCNRHEHWAPIDRYQPCFEIASGGMATVYLARVTARAGFHRFVALKRIHPHLVREPGFVEMFVDEAHVASRIVHPNVCSVFDYEAQGDRHYIAMEYLMGETLSRVSQAMERQGNGPSLERTCSLVARIVADACEGLHAAHELRDHQGESLNAVHRDVSPQNLCLTYDGAVKVVDFGLVRTAQCLHKTKTGMVKGKFAYLAPEAIASKPLDRRTDVWGLGVVLWELVTQQRLFRRDTEVETLLAVTTGDAPAPSTVRPGIPPELDAIVLRALSRSRSERYQTAREMGRDLMRFIHAGSEPAGLPDLAEWMEQLFVGGRARKLQLLEIAGQMSIERSSPHVARVSAIPTLPPPSDFSVATTRAVSSSRIGRRLRRTMPPLRRERRSRWHVRAATWVLAVGTLAACAVVLLIGRTTSQAAPTPPSTDIAPPPRTAALSTVETSVRAADDVQTRSGSCNLDEGALVLEVVRAGAAPDGSARLRLRAVSDEAPLP